MREGSYPPLDALRRSTGAVLRQAEPLGVLTIVSSSAGSRLDEPASNLRPAPVNLIAKGMLCD